MADVVVCVPRARWRDWLGEGSLPGQSAAVQRFGFYVKTDERPPVEPGDRVYVISWDRLRGYAPLVSCDVAAEGWTLIRAGNAVACTLPEETKSFPGWRVRWWEHAAEVPFPDWQTANVADDQRPKAPANARRKTSGLAYATVIRPRSDSPMKPEEFERLCAAATLEIESTGSLSFTDAHNQRQLFIIRCGSPLSRGQRCLRPKGHDGDCKPQWSST